MVTTEYSRRMNRVLDYIDQHLDEALDLNLLAQVAHFSSYHFHRVFSEWVGETLHDYVQRRRLARAAYQLPTRQQASILEVAIAAGFNSGEAFTRAFKRQFGMTPTAWRNQIPQHWKEAANEARARNMLQLRMLEQKDSNFGQTTRPSVCDHEDSSQVEESHMSVKVMDLPFKKVAYFRRFGPYGFDIPMFWKKIVDPWLRENGFDNVSCYGVVYDDSAITPPEKCRYDACVEVPDDYIATDNAMPATLPGGKYAVAAFRGLPEMISDAWSELFRGWLPNSSFQCDARPLFTRFRRNMQSAPDTAPFQCDLCLPIRPL